MVGAECLLALNQRSKKIMIIMAPPWILYSHWCDKAIVHVSDPVTPHAIHTGISASSGDSSASSQRWRSSNTGLTSIDMGSYLGHHGIFPCLLFFKLRWDHVTGWNWDFSNNKHVGNPYSRKLPDQASSWLLFKPKGLVQTGEESIDYHSIYTISYSRCRGRFLNKEGSDQ